MEWAEAENEEQATDTNVKCDTNYVCI